MSTLHSLLAELGLEQPHFQADPAVSYAGAWQQGAAFVPVEGHRYDMVWQEETGAEGAGAAKAAPIRKTIRVDGLHPDLWFDLDSGEPLSGDVAVMPLKAFRDLDPLH